MLSNMFYLDDNYRAQFYRPPVTPQKTVKDIFDNFSEYQKTVAYEIIGQALEYGDYNREVLVVFNNEEKAIIKYLLDHAMKG